MKTLYVDAFAGLAGDMFVAALVHAGAPAEALLGGLRALGVEGWEARFEPAMRGPFAATRFVVDLAWSFAPEADGHEHHHGPDVAGHDHVHAHAPEAGAPPPAGDGRWSTIRARLGAAPLAPPVRERALAIFARLAEAEARVHGVPVDAVAFHEVGAVDSIVDIVAAAIAMEALDVGEVVASPLPLGGGHVRGAHGWIPLPAPATVELLRGFEVRGWPFPGETVTPTGAAILAACARPGPLPPMRVERIGYGAGSRDPGTHPNVLRVLLGEGAAGASTEVVEIAAQIDGIRGEEVPTLIDGALAAGALDAWVTPILMKKGRPAYRFGALAPDGQVAAIGDRLFRSGATLGFRHWRAEREVLDRRWETVDTRFGAIRVKIGARDGADLRVAPEFEDCRAAAAAAGVPIQEVEGAALAAWSTRR